MLATIRFAQLRIPLRSQGRIKLRLGRSFGVVGVNRCSYQARAHCLNLVGSRRLIDDGLRIDDSSAQPPSVIAPGGHLPQRTAKVERAS